MMRLNIVLHNTTDIDTHLEVLNASSLDPWSNLLINSFKVRTETGSVHQIKTIATGFDVTAPPEVEDEVTVIQNSRYPPLPMSSPHESRVVGSHVQLKVINSIGTSEWLDASYFFDDDGTITEALLEFADRDLLQKVFASFTQVRLAGFLAGQTLKATGNKDKQIKRLVKHWIRVKRSPDFFEARLDAKLGPIQHGEESISGIVRRFYTNNYSALDRFDRYWYKIAYPTHNKNWETYYVFCLLHQVVVNAFVAYCKHINRCVEIKEFLKILIYEYVSSL